MVVPSAWGIRLTGVQLDAMRSVLSSNLTFVSDEGQERVKELMPVNERPPVTCRLSNAGLATG